MTEEQEKLIRDAALVYYDLLKEYTEAEHQYNFTGGARHRELTGDFAVLVSKLKAAERALREAQGIPA